MKQTEKKCPIDGRIRPVYITMNGKRVCVIADGKGDAYHTYSKSLMAYADQPRPENLIDPNHYEFERGLNGMDF